MPKEVGSRRRVPLGSLYQTYEEAFAAKESVINYRPDQLQIRKKSKGFQVVARVNINPSKSTENTNND